MGLLSSIFKPKSKDIHRPTVTEVDFNIFAEEINKYPRTYASVFNSREAGKDGELWIRAGNDDYKLYISKCELVK
jgi:hypothetical protein